MAPEKQMNVKQICQMWKVQVEDNYISLFKGLWYTLPQRKYLFYQGQMSAPETETVLS